MASLKGGYGEPSEKYDEPTWKIPPAFIENKPKLQGIYAKSTLNICPVYLEDMPSLQVRYAKFI